MGNEPEIFETRPFLVYSGVSNMRKLAFASANSNLTPQYWVTDTSIAIPMGIFYPTESMPQANCILSIHCFVP